MLIYSDQNWKHCCFRLWGSNEVRKEQKNVEKTSHGGSSQMRFLESPAAHSSHILPDSGSRQLSELFQLWLTRAMSTKHSLRWAWREGGKERENWMCVHKVCFSDSGFQEPAVCVWLVRIWTIFPWSSLNVEKILKYLQEKLYVWDLL